jgi:hypothetical protein
MKRFLESSTGGFLDGSKARSFFVLLCQLVVVASAEACMGSFVPPEAWPGRAARACTVLISFFVVNLLAEACLSNYRVRKLKPLVWLHGMLIFSTLLLTAGRILAAALVNYGETHKAWNGLSDLSLSFGLPVTTCVLIVQSILGLHFGFVMSILSSIVMAVYFPASPFIFLFSLATSMVACLSFIRVRSRSIYLRAALNIALAGIPFALGSIIVEPASGGVVDAVVRVSACFLGGCLSAFLAVGITPIVEYLGGYASDLRLIEMATLDHPLLKELSIQAPGTWNHSMVMGMMVESAADAIGANPVVCRVGAYFHDVGKMKKPLYFVENQDPGENRHDKLSPSMSALIIRSHVKDGVELARKYAIPRVVEDLIPQHHGTSMIEYFYEKAKKEVEESGEDPDTVDRGLYSYPGPKPQTREAGLLMLADGIEAAARTLTDPSSDRIQGMVQKMINKVFASGELNECELTLRDLHLIAKCFTRVLTGIYHQRIAYAEPAEKVNEGDGSAEVKGDDGARPDAGRRSKVPQEDLKRLGLE